MKKKRRYEAYLNLGQKMKVLRQKRLEVRLTRTDVYEFHEIVADSFSFAMQEGKIDFAFFLFRQY